MKKIYLVLEPNYHSTHFFIKNLLATEMMKTQIFMNKPVYSGLSTLELSKILMQEFWHDYLKPKYERKAWIQTFHCLHKKTLLKILKQDLILQKYLCLKL